MREIGDLWLLAITAFILLWLMVLINAGFQVMPANRIRYLMPLWPLAALAGAALISRLTRRLPATLVLIVADLWLVRGVHVSRSTEVRLEIDLLVPSTIHHVWRALDEQESAGDLLVADVDALNRDPARHYDRWLSRPYRILDRHRDETLTSIEDVHERYPWIWLLYLERDRAAVRDTFSELGQIQCETAFSDGEFVLERHALPGLACPIVPDRYSLEPGFTLTEPAITLRDDVLAIDLLARSDDAHAFTHYSITLQLFNVETLDISAQVDFGIGRGEIVPLYAEMDVTQLPPGEYALRMALYNWETGERSVARDLLLGHVSDIHTLQHIVLE